jgi:hypothetical protein
MVRYYYQSKRRADMAESDVVEKLIELHREYQEAGGFDDMEKVLADSRPLGDLKGFESDFIPEIVRRAARELGCPLKKGVRVKNIYVDNGRKLTIREIARKLIEKYVPGGCKV